MTGLELQVMEARLERLAQLLALLERDRSVVDRIPHDVDVRDRVERRLHLAAQVAIDVANYLIARFRWPRSDQETLWEVLAREQVITSELAQALDGLVGFRNVLVHEYLGIDLDIVAQAVLKDTDDLAAFRKQLLGYLDSMQ